MAGSGAGRFVSQNLPRNSALLRATSATANPLAGRRWGQCRGSQDKSDTLRGRSRKGGGDGRCGVPADDPQADRRDADPIAGPRRVTLPAAASRGRCSPGSAAGWPSSRRVTTPCRSGGTDPWSGAPTVAPEVERAPPLASSAVRMTWALLAARRRSPISSCFMGCPSTADRARREGPPPWQGAITLEVRDQLMLSWWRRGTPGASPSEAATGRPGGRPQGRGK